MLQCCELCIRAHHAFLEPSCFSSVRLVTGVRKAHVAEQVVRKLLQAAPRTSAGERSVCQVQQAGTTAKDAGTRLGQDDGWCNHSTAPLGRAPQQSAASPAASCLG